MKRRRTRPTGRWAYRVRPPAGNVARAEILFSGHATTTSGSAFTADSLGSQLVG